MLFLIIILLFTKASCTENVGSVLFFKRNPKGCWNQDDLAKLRARKIFEDLILPTVPPDKINSKIARETLKYYRRAVRSVVKERDPEVAAILKDALIDTIGGHFRKEILPTVRFAYYAGYIPYRDVKKMHNYYENLKSELNTQGIGWSPPDNIPLQSNLTVGKILIGVDTPFDPCSYLVVKRDAHDCIHVPSPMLDDESLPSALALPFVTGGFVSLSAPSSESILLKYYTTSARCILSDSPETCRHSDFVNFNNDLWHWMKRNVAPHLMDEKLYAAYGGVLRIAAAVQTYGKGLSRRNLYDYEMPPTFRTSWNPMKAISDSQYYVDCDWSPKLYMAVIIGVALAVCCIYSCYTVICKRAAGCRCRGRSSSRSKDICYAQVESSFQPVTPVNTEKSTRNDLTAAAAKTQSQKVFDFNENTEKFMSVIMSDDQSELMGSSTSRDSYSVRKSIADSVRIQSEVKPRSPPRIDAPIAQLKLPKSPPMQSNRSGPMYSTTTVTHSEVTYCGQVSETVWSGSYTTDNSASSVSNKTHSLKSRRSRDLAWARRVISKQNLKSSAATDPDLQSYTTPPSKRYRDTDT